VGPRTDLCLLFYKLIQQALEIDPVPAKLLAGIGNAWNNMAYKDKDNEPGDLCPNENLNLNSNTRASFAWEAGAGLMYTLNNRAALTLQYLWADLGKASSSAGGTARSITAPSIVPPSFNLRAQTMALGLHITA